VKKSGIKQIKGGKNIKKLFTIWGTPYNCELPLVSLIKMLDAAVKKTNTLKLELLFAITILF